MNALRLLPCLALLAVAGCVTTVPQESDGPPVTLPPPPAGVAASRADMTPICTGQVVAVTGAPVAAITALSPEEDRGELLVRARHVLESGIIDFYECVFTPEGLYRGVRRTA